MAEDKAARLAAEKWDAAADAACHMQRAARLEAELAEVRAQLGRSAEEATAAADARAAEVGVTCSPNYQACTLLVGSPTDNPPALSLLPH